MTARCLTAHPTDAVDELLLSAANRIIAEQSTAIATAHSSLLAGNVDYAIEILGGAIRPGDRT